MTLLTRSYRRHVQSGRRRPGGSAPRDIRTELRLSDLIYTSNVMYIHHHRRWCLPISGVETGIRLNSVGMAPKASTLARIPCSNCRKPVVTLASFGTRSPTIYSNGNGYIIGLTQNRPNMKPDRFFFHRIQYESL